MEVNPAGGKAVSQTCTFYIVTHVGRAHIAGKLLLCGRSQNLSEGAVHVLQASLLAPL